LAGPQLRARVDNDDMALFEVLHQGMEVLEVETTARVVAAELVFAFHSGKRVHDGASVRLYGGGYLSRIPNVGGI